MNNDQQHRPWLFTRSGSQCLLVTAVQNSKQTGMSGRVSQWPMCQRDECWKLLGKRIRAVYVGQVARCQLLNCANFLKLQSFGLVMSLFLLYLPSIQYVWKIVLCGGEKPHHFRGGGWTERKQKRIYIERDIPISLSIYILFCKYSYLKFKINGEDRPSRLEVKANGEARELAGGQSSAAWSEIRAGLRELQFRPWNNIKSIE